MKNLKAGVIGLGIGKQHVRVLKAMSGVDLVGVVDMRAELAQEVARQHGVKAFVEAARLLHEESLDFVCICTPPASHAALTEQAAERGVHVFCEKPMAATLADCDRMIRSCEKAGVKLMIGQKKRFHPNVQFVKERTASDFGPIRWATIRYACGRVPMDWFWDEADGGGPLHENSVHAMDLLRHLVGDVERVYAEGGNLFNPSRRFQEDAAVVSLRFKNGAVAAIGCGQTWEWSFSGEGAWLATERAVIEMTGGFDNPRHLKYLLRDNPENTQDMDAGEVDLFERELAHFVGCIREDRTVLVTGEEGRASIAVCLAVKESIRTGKAVKPR